MRGFCGDGAVKPLHRQRQARPNVVFDGGQMRLAQLVPDARGHIPTDHTVVQHGNAGATNHGVQLVANHEVSQRPHNAMMTPP